MGSSFTCRFWLMAIPARPQDCGSPGTKGMCITGVLAHAGACAKPRHAGRAFAGHGRAVVDGKNPMAARAEIVERLRVGYAKAQDNALIPPPATESAAPEEPLGLPGLLERALALSALPDRRPSCCVRTG